MEISRRDFLKAAAAVGAVAGVEFGALQDALGATADPRVIWLQGQGCTGCSVSFLNSIYYASAADVVLKTIDLEFHSTLMASAGSRAWNHATSRSNGYILVVEGAIPTGSSGKFCTVGNDMTVLNALKFFAPKCSRIIAVGTCASYGGISAAKPNPTAAKSVTAALSYLGISKTVINIPGCPVHPDWLVGTISYILTNNATPSLDSSRRPRTFFGTKVHDKCPNLSSYNTNYSRQISHAGDKACLTCHTSGDSDVRGAKKLGNSGCLYALNCKGKLTYADCPTRKWNSSGVGKTGINWCIGAKAPCHGCTQPNFPDGMSPFYTLSGRGVESDDDGGGTSTTQVRCSDCHSNQGSTGTLPGGHPSVDSSHNVTGSGTGTGGTTTTNQVRCSDCHSNEGSTGTLPSGHPSVSSSHYVSGTTTPTGSTSSTSTSRDDDDERDDDERDDD